MQLNTYSSTRRRSTGPVRSDVVFFESSYCVLPYVVTETLAPLERPLIETGTVLVVALSTLISKRAVPLPRCGGPGADGGQRVAEGDADHVFAGDGELRESTW
jgi:hypothetical protein